jgi:hypothetical protein
MLSGIYFAKKVIHNHISGSVDEELLLRNEYLVAENRILHDQIKGRVQLSDAERQTLAEIGKRLGKQALEEVANIVKPDTILGWHRKLGFWVIKSLRRSRCLPKVHELASIKSIDKTRRVNICSAATNRPTSWSKVMAAATRHLVPPGGLI